MSPIFSLAVGEHKNCFTAKCYTNNFVTLSFVQRFFCAVLAVASGIGFFCHTHSHKQKMAGYSWSVFLAFECGLMPVCL
jgi:hypothetical protein